MAAIPQFPESLLREHDVQWDIAGSTIGGGQTASGLAPTGVRVDGGGYWKASLNDISLRTANHVRSWRALSAIADGGAQPLIVPMCDRRHMPAPLVGGVPLYSLAGVPHSDDSPFSDDSLYASDVIAASLGASAALRATSIIIDMVAGGDLQGGEYFSIDHETLRWRLYRIRTAIDNGDGSWDVTIRPPLRAAVSASTPLQFDRPKCVMRLARSDSMDLVLELRKHGSPSVSFVEAFPPFPE